MRPALTKIIANIPNAISIARLASTPILAASIFWNDRFLFSWLFLACLMSDIIDGGIARSFNLQSKSGATLDSVADLLVTGIGFVAVVVFEPTLFPNHYVPILAVAGLYMLSVLCGFWRYGRMTSFHTLNCRLAAYAQGAFVMGLFLWGYQAALFWTMIAISVIAYLEELAIICVLREWRCDVRGIYSVLPR